MPELRADGLATRDRFTGWISQTSATPAQRDARELPRHPMRHMVRWTGARVATPEATGDWLSGRRRSPARGWLGTGQRAIRFPDAARFPCSARTGVLDRRARCEPPLSGPDQHRAGRPPAAGRASPIPLARPGPAGVLPPRAGARSGGAPRPAGAGAGGEPHPDRPEARRRARPPLAQALRAAHRRPAAPLHVAIDSAERYPWRFPGAAVERRKLRAGDYALLEGDRITAVLERKSFDNFLGDLGAIQALHGVLADLASHPRAALVVEAQYGDFLDERRVRGRWPVAHLARALAELAALHPRLPVVFAGSRKLANLWAERFFAACAASSESPQLELVRETLVRYDEGPRGPGLDQEIREAVLAQLGPAFAIGELARRFPEVKVTRLRRVLADLKREGRVIRTGAGLAARWVPAPSSGTV